MPMGELGEEPTWRREVSPGEVAACGGEALEHEFTLSGWTDEVGEPGVGKRTLQHESQESQRYREIIHTGGAGVEEEMRADSVMVPKAGGGW